jgi:hypothetical protein
VFLRTSSTFIDIAISAAAFSQFDRPHREIGDPGSRGRDRMQQTARIRFDP